MTEASLAEALAAAGEVPAAAIGVPSLSPGAPADLVLLDQRGFPVRVMRNGGWLD